MFKRVLWITFGSLATLVGLFFLGGKFADPNYSGSRSAIVEASPEKVWSLVSDPKAFAAQRHEVKSIEIVESKIPGFPKWQENTGLAGSISLEVVGMEPGRLVEVQMLESGFGMTGTWKYEIEPEGNNTRVTITENSRTEGLVMRSILNALGRDANMGLHLKAISKGAKL